MGSTGGRRHIYPQDKTTPLFIAASGGHADAARARIEAGAEVDVACGDSAVTHPVGEVSPEVRRLLDCTSGVLALAMSMAS